MHPNANPTLTRAIWADVTADPHVTITALAARYGRGVSTIQHHLLKLERLGYIRCEGWRARRIIVPLYSQVSHTGGAL